MKRLILITKVLILIFFLSFISISLSGPKDSNKDMQTVLADTISNVDMSMLEKKDNISIKRFLNIDPDFYEEIVYFKNLDTMQADELVLVKFKTNDQSSTFEEEIKLHVDAQENIFSGYAPKEEDKLKNSVLEVHANYALFVVSPNASILKNQFLTSLE